MVRREIIIKLFANSVDFVKSRFLLAESAGKFRTRFGKSVRTPIALQEPVCLVPIPYPVAKGPI